jgi:hypothetical protein
MRIRIAIEDGAENRSQAWALDYPGCFSYGADTSEAILTFPMALISYAAWVKKNAGQVSWMPVLGNFDIQLVDTWKVYTINDQYELADEGYEVNAWFRDDWRPLTGTDVEHGLQILAWSRADLLATVQGLTPAQLDEDHPGERWSIAGILKHIAGAEWWYLDRLGMAVIQRAEVKPDPFERLAQIRPLLTDALTSLVESSMVVGVDGEFWSPRKLLRRAVWHELDHIQHIQKIINP